MPNRIVKERHILPVMSICLISGLLFISCGQRKATYNVDSLIEGYAYEEGTEYIDLQKEDNNEDAQIEVSNESLSEETDEAVVADPEDEVLRFPQRVPGRHLGRLSEVFNDSNYRQYAYAERLGIEPIRGIAQAFHTRRPIVKVTSNKDYTVDELTHSLPYLVPEAERLLRDIGRNFQDSLKRQGKARYRIRATSLLRTPATVKKLRRVNINATDSSTHQFGTTFDLSYHRFHCLDSTYQLSNEYLKNLLAEVLYDLREDGRCLVKFERKTGCFHVTVTK